MFRRPAWLCLHFASCVVTQQNATFWGLRTPAVGYDPQIRTRPRFLYDASTAPPPIFIILCLFVRNLSCSHTNPQTHPQTNRFRRKHATFFTTLRRWVIKSIEIETYSHTAVSIATSKAFRYGTAQCHSVNIQNKILIDGHTF